jgi:hypothetical protein
MYYIEILQASIFKGSFKTNSQKLIRKSFLSYLNMCMKNENFNLMW